MAQRVLVAEKDVDLEMENIKIGTVKVQVFEGPPVHLQTEGVNPRMLIARAEFHGKVYEMMSSRGGIEGVVEELKRKILDDVK